MGFALTAKDYADYLCRAYDKIHSEGDYITALDAATGDGDHWTNINMGFAKLMEISDELAGMSLFDEFKKIGMTMMSVIGGSSGVLYGSAYLEAAKTLQGKDVIDSQALCGVLEAMLGGIMKRGEGKPGMKTMIDALYPAVEAYKQGLASGMDEAALLEKVKQAAADGAQSTKDMEAVRGRACYQADKGVGHLDPGAVTMAYQMEELMQFVLEKR